MTPTHSEVIYETQPSFVVHECAGHCGLLEAAVDLVRCPGRYVHFGPRSASGFFVELDLEHASSGGSVQPVHNCTAGLVQQRFCDAATG